MQKKLLCAIKAALQAGEDIMKVYQDPLSDFEVEKKADNSPLTIADKKSHQRIVSFLEQMPYPILSEEGKQIDYTIRKEWNELWIVDPLDGTKEFIKRNGEFTVNIAWVKNSVPVLGVIYVPVKKVLYYGCEKLGAYKITDISSLSFSETIESLIQKSLPLPIKEKRETFMVVASRSHLSYETESYIKELEKTHSAVQTLSVGSSIKICFVAEGVADVYPRFAPTMEWDTAAGHAIVRASGKEIYQENTSNNLVYNKKDLLNPWFVVR